MNTKRFLSAILAGLTVFHGDLPGFRFPTVVRASSGLPFQAATSNPDSLTAGRVVAGELKAGEKSVFPVRLKTGDFLKLTVRQRGIDTAARLVGPDGKTLWEANWDNGRQGSETLTAVAATAGTYQVEVISVEKNAPPGRYELKVEALRAASPEDAAENEATRLVQEGFKHTDGGRYDDAAAVGERGLELCEKSFGEDHPLTAQVLNLLGRVWHLKGDLAKAEPPFRRALTIREKLFGPEHGLVSESLNNLGTMLEDKGDYAEAEAMLVRSLAVREKLLGPENREVAQACNNLAQVYETKGDYARAEPLFERALAVWEKALGPEHEEVAAALTNLAGHYRRRGDLAKAETMYLRSLSIYEKALGTEHPTTGIVVNNLALFYKNKGDYAGAEAYFDRALAVWEKAGGPNHSNVAAILNNQAVMYRDLGNYAKSEAAYLRALSIWERNLGPEHRNVADGLANLAGLYVAQGDYARAEIMLVRSLTIREKVFGPEHADTANSLNTLGDLYRLRGDYAKSKAYFERALAIYEKTFGPEHPLTGFVVNNLAVLAQDMDDFAKAEPLLLRTLALREKARGPDHPDVALALNNLAYNYLEQHRGAEAEPLLLRALAIREKVLGKNNPAVAYPLNNLGGIYQERGDYARAGEMYQRALAVSEKSLSRGHPEIVLCLNNLADLYAAEGNADQATAYRARCNDECESDLVRNLISGSERQKALYLRRTAFHLNVTISIHTMTAPRSAEATRMALTVVLRRKGRSLDAMTAGVESLRERARPEDQAVLDELTQANTYLSNVILKGPGREGVEAYQARVKELRDRVEALENRVSERNVEFRVELRPVMLEEVQRAVPKDAVLVEFASYVPFDAKSHKSGNRRYVAYVLGNAGDPKWADLGPAEPIDRMVDEFRAALRRETPSPKQGSASDRRDVRAIGRNLDKLVMAPVRALVGNVSHLLVSPDGMLNLIPFAALVDERGKFLVERYLISYLASGRDLPRLRERIESQGPPLVVADPDYSVGKGPRLLDEQLHPLLRLIATAREAASIRSVFPSAVVKTGDAATETFLKSAAGPRFLHIATHGYFLNDAPDDAPVGGPEARNLTPVSLNSGNIEKIRAANPLLRSWLFLAGANKGGEGGDDDGTMTALEAARLNLHGTKLVVLSACDTGLGVVRNGEGVYGLRRALVLAGSEAQMISLWPVSDRGTLDLMRGYYRRLGAGEGRAEALRNTQLEMLDNPKRRHPFYWAGFIHSGAWTGLDDSGTTGGEGENTRPGSRRAVAATKETHR